MSGPSPNLIGILRSVLARMEEDPLFDPSDPAVQRFRQRILRSISQLELTRNSLKPPDVITPEPAAPPRPPAALPNAAPASQGKPRPPNDSVVILVTHRPRKPGKDGGGESPAV